MEAGDSFPATVSAAKAGQSEPVSNTS
jgi:hypothetical protein